MQKPKQLSIKLALTPRALVLFVLIFILSFALYTYTRPSTPNNTASALTSDNLNFQGRLLNASGNIVPDGFYNIQFNIYNVSSGGSTLWTETRDFDGTDDRVRLVNGYFSVNLGSVNDTLMSSGINWDQEHWLGMTVRGSGTCIFASTCTPADIEMTPRLKLSGVPYAFTAGQLQATSGANELKVTLATPTADVTYLFQDTTAGTYNVCTTASVCTGYAAGSGSANYIQNGTTTQTANYNIQSSAAGNIGAIIQGHASQTADIFQVKGTTANPLFSITGTSGGATGSATFRNATDSATAFQIQNAAGVSLFNIDSTNSGNITLLGNNGGEVQSWQSTSVLPANRHSADLVTSNGYAYYIGGINGGGEQTTAYYAKINTNGTVGSWNTTTVLPAARGDHSTVVANGYMYVVGGLDASNSYRKTVYFAKINADGTLGSWSCQGADSTVCATTPINNNTPGVTNGILGHQSVVANGYIYTFGGDDGGTILSAVYRAKLNADGTTGAWSTTTAMPVSKHYHALSSANGYVYVSGGINGSGTHNTVFYARVNTDGTVGSWSCQGANATDCGGLTPVNANYLTVERRGVRSVIVNGYIYVGGGRNAVSTYYNNLLYAPLNADGSTGAWTATTNTFTTAKWLGGMVTQNGYIYYAGGDSGGAVSTSDIYYTSTARIKVGGNLDLVGLSGENMNEGGSGGSLTAGNTNIVGSLSVQDQASFNNGVYIRGNITNNGYALFQNSTDSTSAFQIQNAAGSSALTVDTTALNSNVSNPSFEVNTTGWVANGTGASIARNTTEKYIGTASLAFTTGTAVGNSARLTVGTALTTSTTYTLSFYAKAGTAFSTLSASYSPDGTTANETDCAVFNPTRSVLTTGWTRYHCTINTSATASTASGFVAIKQSDATSRVLYIDAVQIEAGSAITQALVTNNGFESAIAAPWSYSTGVGTGTLTQNATPYNGAQSGRVTITAGAVGAGARFVTNTGASTSLAQNATYVLSFRAKAVSGAITNLSAGYARDGLSQRECSLNSASVTTTDWGYYYCLITTDGTAPAATAFITIKESTAVVQTWDIDDVQLTRQSFISTGTGFRETAIHLNGAIQSPTTFKNQSDSTTAFQIQNSSGTSLLTADTINSRINIGSNGAATGQLYVSGLLPSTAIGSVATDDSPYDVQVQGNYAYVVNAGTPTSNFRVIDVTRPNNPVSVGTLSLTTEGTGNLDVQGNYVYITNTTAGTLRVIDVSNPTAPTSVASVTTGASPFGIQVVGRYAYIASFGSETLEIFDIANPTSPVRVSTTSTGAGTSPRKILVQGNYAYVFAFNTGALQVYNISNPVSPSLVSSLTTPAQVKATAIDGRYVYLASQITNELVVVDISNPASLAIIGRTSIPSNSGNGMAILGRYAYTTSLDSPTVGVFDISNPTTPSSVGGITTTSTNRGLYVKGRYLYVAVFGADTMEVYDIGGTYSQSLEAGSIDTSNLSTDDLVVSGGANITNGLSVNGSSQLYGYLGVGGQVLLKNQTNSTTAFQIQNATSGANGNLFLADTTNINLVTNGSAETNATGWAINTGSGSAPASSATYQLYGNSSLAINTSATANAGAKFDSATLLNPSTVYTLSFWAKIGAGSFTVEAGRSDTDVFAGETACTLSSTSVTTTWNRFSCSFTTGATITTGGYVFIRQSDSTSRTWYIDGIQLETGPDPTPYREGKLQFNGTITSPTVFKNQADSTGAFQVQNASGSATVLNVDTTGSGLVTLSSNVNVQSTGTSVFRVSRGAVTNFGSQVFATNLVDKWTVGLVNDSTDDFNFTNSTSGITSLKLSNTDYSATFRAADAGSTTAFRIQNAGGTNTLFVADSTNSRIQVGSAVADGTGTVLVLDTKNTAGDPTGTVGATYYNSNLGKFRCYVVSAWADCDTTGAGGTLQGAYTASTGGTTSEIILDATRGAVDIQDRSTSAGGTIGANLLNIRATAANDSTAGTLLFSIGNTGAVLSQNSVNSATAFQVQNAAGTTMLNVGTLTPIITTGGNIAPSIIATQQTTATTSTVMTSTNSQGQYSSIAIGTDGLPIISHRDDNATDLVITKCGNIACSSGNTSTTITSANDQGTYSSIAIGTDGLPIISHYDQTAGVLDLVITKCGNIACSSGNTSTTITSANDQGTDTSITIGTDGLPIISYRDVTATDLVITKCGNSACSSGNTTTTITSANDQAWNSSIAIGTDGFPIIAHGDQTAGVQDLVITKCGNSACSSGNTTTTITSANFQGIDNSITIGTDGLPIISHHDNNVLDLIITKCGNIACSSGNTSTTITSANSQGYSSSIAVGTDGLPVISHRDQTVGVLDLVITKCGNIACSSGNTSTIITTASNRGVFSSIAIGTDGLPVIAHHDNATFDLVITKCGNPACSASGTTLTGGLELGSGATPFQNAYIQSIRTNDSVNPFTIATNGVNRLSITSDGGINFLGASNFGALVTAGAFVDNNSYFGEEFNQATGVSTTADGANFGDNLTWYGDTTSALWTMSQTARLNGTLRAVSTNTAAAGLSFAFGNVGNTPDKIWATNNLPVAQIKFMTNNSAGTTNDYFIGLTNAGAATATDNTLPTDGVYFTNNNTGSWVGQVRVGSATVGTTAACGTISTTAFAIMRIEVRTTNTVRFLLDRDVSDGVNLVDCGTVAGTLSGATLLGANVNVIQADIANDPTIDIDYFRVWQDDAPIIPTIQNSNNETTDDQVILQENATLDPENILQTGNFSDINIANSANIKDLTVSGTTNLTTLIVSSNAVFSANITVAGHIITAGDIPASAVLGASGTTVNGATVSVEGNDVSGLITITTAGTGTLSAGDLAKLTFAKIYDISPVVTITPVGTDAAKLQTYITQTRTDFTLSTNTTPLNATTYKFNYHVIQ